MPTRQCPICAEQIAADFFDRHIWRERRFIKTLREEHPEWNGNHTPIEELVRTYKEEHEALRLEARRLRMEHGELLDEPGAGGSDDVGDEIPETELHIATDDDDYDRRHNEE